MITLKPNVPFTGPYRRPVRWLDVAVNVSGLAAIGVLLAVSVLGMTGAFETEQPSMTLACVSCAGGVGR